MADSGLEAMLAAGGGAEHSAAHGGHAPAEAVPVEELVPHVVRGANTAIYGYDIAGMKERPWAQPGVNQADYFNYDFDEGTYRAYCAMHAQGPSSVKLKAEQYVTKIFGADAGAYNGGGGGGGGGDHFHQQQGGFQRQAPMMQQPQQAQGHLIPRAKLHKTKPCYAFRDGLCQRGDGCPYAHGDQELQQGRAQLAAYESEMRGPNGGPAELHQHHHQHYQHQQHHHHHHHGQMQHHHGHHHHHHHHAMHQPQRPQPSAEQGGDSLLGAAPQQAGPPPPPRGDDDGLFEAPPGLG
jgi:hypothetical protein